MSHATTDVQAHPPEDEISRDNMKNRSTASDTDIKPPRRPYVYIKWGFEKKVM